MNDAVKHIASRVWRHLGPGFSERVYHTAMEVVLRAAGIPYQTERIVPIMFENHAIGNIRADLIVDTRLLVELKSVRGLKDEHRVQARMYMRLLELREGLLVNFPNTGNDIEIEHINMSEDIPTQGLT